MLNPRQKKQLKANAHKLKPVVLMGASGLTDNVLAAIEEALDHHELIKIKISAGDRDERDDIIKRILDQSKAELIQRVGNIATIYRESSDE
ncbi:MAG: ribosome assembly RNA-binding protein YhbY [Gammaproteobacteria bacterium]|nr:MAG: ribosome assembly RNA-binding protein YhbY [Gammaproteobacteria bacterium]